MKKLLLILLCLPFIGFGQDGEIRKYSKEGGKLLSVINYIDGEKNGSFEYYWENGKLLCEGTYMNGQKTGLHKTYYNNGIIQNKGEYLNGTKVGIWRDYNNNGDLKNEVKHLFKVDPIDDECPLPILKKKIIIE